MKYRKVGNSSIKVSKIALGTWLTFGGSEGYETTRECVKTAVDRGVNYLDVADAYANGEAERIIGKVIKDLGLNRQHLVIASKLYWPMSEDVNDRGLSRKHIMESIDGSLERMGLDYLDFYFCHRYDPETPIEEVVRAMDDLVHRGKILYWGTSVWSAAQLELAHGTAGFVNAYKPQIEQPPYNMLNRGIEREVLPTAARKGMGVVVFSPLAQGLLTGKYNDGIPEDSRAARSDWLNDTLTEENLEKTRQLSALADELGITAAQLALAWILRRPEISAAITGATKVKHVRDNVQASEVELSPDVLARIEEILDNNPLS